MAAHRKHKSSSMTGWAYRLMTRVHDDLTAAIGGASFNAPPPPPPAAAEAGGHATVENFLREAALARPVRFTARQLAEVTRGYSTLLGAGGFGAVYLGALPGGGLPVPVAVKVLHGGLDRRRSAEQFMAEVGTIGRTHHVNLVRLLGFCFDGAVRALVYEHAARGALDGFLRRQGGDVGVAALREVAAGVARGIRYLHEECDPKIVHYDIKPGNVLLDGELTPKVADFGLARLVDRADTHVSVSGVRGTPGYAAPELWTGSGVTEKCDVYSFGMLLLEIVGRRRNFDGDAPESRQWFPRVAWTKYENGELAELAGLPGADDGDVRRRTAEETVERMCKVAFWCVQQAPEARPPMGVVVKMLEGEMDVAPPANPFQHLMAPPAPVNLWVMSSSGTTASATDSGIVSDGSSGIVTL
ncbi:hypothetical protein ACP4OV_011817 [Aristida adscensionis]